ncbi:hypothetical protein CYLTODRAFT_420230 [Cylindrobasidium torrendii FP15055 ss-10]|uniref:Uncharacterized protein n=1 Tax=Cylindrobasidium torrendii FP15055 ss-10 TaxID=1314674 RepID=A0A0D7BIL2_9AGAR|nr:hypothetical protein CYLTODRAFT_420230 [Cylindrobasidium torrendii FP15055 ss-10]
MSTLTETMPAPALKTRACHFAPPPEVGKFAFARLRRHPFKGVHLVQLAEPTPDSSTKPTHITLHLFRHEFISIFRHAGSATMPPDDVRILQVVDDAAKRYEEDDGVVFLDRAVAIEGMRR